MSNVIYADCDTFSKEIIILSYWSRELP